MGLQVVGLRDSANPQKKKKKEKKKKKKHSGVLLGAGLYHPHFGTVTVDYQVPAK